ncbi:hypothetical protein chiPu_0029024, partial [Chiloscyllium punctatum]|nr:hypothetical protein [Chiloscyllium punctatum]
MDRGLGPGNGPQLDHHPSRLQSRVQARFTLHSGHYRPRGGRTDASPSSRRQGDGRQTWAAGSCHFRTGQARSGDSRLCNRVVTITTRSGIKMNVDIDALRKHIGTKIVEHDVATQAPLRG